MEHEEVEKVLSKTDRIFILDWPICLTYQSLYTMLSHLWMQKSGVREGTFIKAWSWSRITLSFLIKTLNLCNQWWPSKLSGQEYSWRGENSNKHGHDWRHWHKRKSEIVRSNNAMARIVVFDTRKYITISRKYKWLTEATW